MNGISSDESYNFQGKVKTHDIKFTVDGNNSTNFNIYGNMFTGINACDNGKYNFDNLNNFNIINTYQPTKVQSNQIGIWLRSDTQVNIDADNLYIGGVNGSDETFFGSAFRIANGSKLNVSVNDKFTLTSSKIGIDNAASYAYINADTVNIYATGDDASERYGAILQGGGYLNLKAINNINLSGSGVGLRFNFEGPTFPTNGSVEYYEKVLGEAEVTSEEGSIFIEGREGYGLLSEIRQHQDSQDGVKKAVVTADKDIKIEGKKSGVSYYAASRMLDVTSKNSNIHISSDNIGLSVGGSVSATVEESYLRGKANFDALNGSIDVYGQKSGIVADNSQVNVIKELDGINTRFKGAYFANVNITAKDAVNIVGTDDYGIQAKNTLSDIELKDSALPKDVNLNLKVKSQGTINVFGGKAGIMATAVKDEFDNGVLNTLSNTNFGSKVNLNANGDIAVQGGDYGVIAFENSNVDITSDNGNVLIGATDTNTNKVSNTAAVYAENGAKTQSTVIQSTVNINAGNGVVSILSGNKGLWASGKGGTINVDGAVNINANYFNGEQLTRSSGDNVHLAVVAGLKSEDETENGTGLVDIDLKGDVTSSIYGDIVGARGGEVDIKRESGNGALVVNGDVLAGNGGTVSLDMGKNGVLTGRIDDYMDASAEHGNSFFAPQFSYEIKDSGKVDLKLGDGSRWNVDGQSWVTTINAGKNTVIDLTGAATDRNTTAHALTIGTLNGDANFRMNLDGFDKANSDMLYIKNSNGEYNVILDDAVTSEEIGETGLRFATIDNGNVNFKNVVVYNAGAFDVKYKVGKDAYEGHLENDDYNGTEFGEVKPGTEAVDKFFKGEESTINKLADSESTLTNYKIVDVHSRELNNTGKTIVGMSRANYSNAIYMDRLNKRLGEARYINGEEDQGMWVRIRHDRIGKDNAFRSQNNMYELGYDEKQECDNGERRVGFAVDYMHGDTSYSNISGKGEIDRYGLWLYDTWMGDKGHYADYVAKWGHLKNDFGIYAAGVKDKITGDYSNNVFSISAEYGRKKDIGNDWYIEPQAQLQLARVTGADYVTNQNTKVSVDGINSLIGRAGFRIGKDFGEEKQSTVYLKADVMHEFLGDQDISLKDKTSDGNWSTISYENEGTWYDIGLGFATMMSKNSYAFVDLEKSFGHDNDETYQINAGVQWSF